VKKFLMFAALVLAGCGADDDTSEETSIACNSYNILNATNYELKLTLKERTETDPRIWTLPQGDDYWFVYCHVSDRWNGGPLLDANVESIQVTTIGYEPELTFTIPLDVTFWAADNYPEDWTVKYRFNLLDTYLK
jgi:hypothetical protein